MTVDVKNFYLNTPMRKYEHLQMHMSDIPDDVQKQYKPNDKDTTNRYVHVEIQKGMYGLLQAGWLAQDLLEKRIKQHGYYQSKLTPGLWLHKKWIQFSLIVDDFRVKYTDRQDAEHLHNILTQHYKISMDFTGQKYIDVTLDWDYQQNNTKNMEHIPNIHSLQTPRP